MLPTRILLVLLLAILSTSEVVVLDDSNFTTYISEHPYVFVEFYAPWCGHCKALAPEYEKLAELANGKEYTIAKVDSTVAEKASAEFKVEGYPTIKFLANGFPIDFKGERTAAGMQKWLDSFFTSKIASLSESEIKEKIGSEDFLLIQGASADQLKVLEIANFVDESVPYYSLSEGEYKITLHLKKDSKILDFSGELSVKELTSWTLENSLPIVVRLNGEQQTRAIFENEQKLPAFLLYNPGGFPTAAFEKLEQLCEENKAVFKCAYVDPVAALFQGVGRYLKTTQTDGAVLAYVNYGLKVGYKFPSPADISSESLAQFLQDVKGGKVDRFIDTQKDKKQKQVKYVNVLKLNAENYNSTLKDNKYVFVQYYSPNCGHCVKFAPQYQKLATKVKEEGLGFVIAAIDLVAEKEVSNWVEIQGYPTLRLFINGKSIEYSGDREAEEILKFVTQAINTKLLTAASVEEVPIPSVAIYGVAEQSDLNLLPIIFTRHPIYHINGDFKVQIHTKKGVQTYSGEPTLQDIANWLEDSTEPLVVGVVDQKPTKRLSKALEGQSPLLVIVKRDQTSTHVLEVLESYCVGKTGLVCGYAGKGDQDYESFNEWLADKTPEKSLLVFIDTTSFKKTFFEGDLSTLTEQQVASFIEDSSKKEEAPKQAEETAQAEQTVEIPVETPVESPAEVPVEAPTATTEDL